MNGKELLCAALQNQKTERAAWLPFVGCHGGFMLGKSASEYLQSADLMIEGLKKAHELYRPDGLPVAFDLQIEAEILGCTLSWADEVPPAVTSHPLQKTSFEELPALDESKGRFPVVTRVLDTLKKDIGETTALVGLICGPFTLALHLYGNDIFLDMYDEEDKVAALLMNCAKLAAQSAEIYLEHGADVIAVVDPMTSQISPDHFEQFVTPAVNHVFDHVKSRDRFCSLFVCGDATRNLEVMAKTHADNLCVDEQIPLAKMKGLGEKYNKSFGGNMKLTSVLLLGDEAASRKEALSCLDEGGTKGFVLAPGCDLPYAVPPKNLQAVAEMVHDEYARKIAREAAPVETADDFSDVEVPDYAHADTVILDVITLDSASCAPCQYMWDAVVRAAETSGVEPVIHEHKIKAREGIGMMVKLGVKNLPTICIDGEVKFASLIPDQKTLVQAIREADTAHASKAVVS